MATEPQIRSAPEEQIDRGLDAASIARDVLEKLYFELA